MTVRSREREKGEQRRASSKQQAEKERREKRAGSKRKDHHHFKGPLVLQRLYKWPLLLHLAPKRREKRPEREKGEERRASSKQQN